MPLTRRTFCLFAALSAPLLALPLALGTFRPARSSAPPATFRNPLKVDGADPFLTHYKGYYYLCTTSAVDIRLRRARRLADLKTAPDTVVWKDTTPGRDRDLWAAEFHRLDSGDGRGPRWYCYYTASDGKEDNNHRLFVLESAGDDILGPYTFKAKLLTDPDDKFYAIDGSVITGANGARYFVWCGRPSQSGQGLYISRMTNPWTLTGPRTYLEVEGFGCQVVREGPVVLTHNGRGFLTYSVCGASTPDYKMGMISADLTTDLTQPASWKQHPKPVFARVDQRQVWGPGHNFFFKSPDGKQDWNVYHAKTSTRDTYADRTCRAQPVTWRRDGTPDFGLPEALDTDIPVPSGEPK